MGSWPDDGFLQLKHVAKILKYNIVKLLVIFVVFLDGNKILLHYYNTTGLLQLKIFIFICSLKTSTVTFCTNRVTTSSEVQVQGLLNVKNIDNFTLPVDASNFNYSSQGRVERLHCMPACPAVGIKW
jgi:hypothetical protein